MAICTLSLLLLSAANNSYSPSQAAQKPNIIFILTDDQRYDTIQAEGNKFIQTPNLDKLARQGASFTNSFVTTSICCVSRASVLTGQYARRHKINDFATPLTQAQWKKSYPALLKNSGYRTGFIGKFGVGNAQAINEIGKQFDYWKGVPGGGSMHFIEPNDPTNLHQTARFGNQAIEFLETQEKEQPFCLSISFTAPHARDNMPREFTPDVRDEPLYQSIIFPQPPKSTDKDFAQLPKAVQESEARRRWFWRFDTKEKYQKTRQDYYRLISGIDRELGRIRTLLQEKQLHKNTIIIFTSDNGYFLGERQLAGKWFMYEESIRTPFIIFDPRLPTKAQGKKHSELVLNIDVMPTILDIANLNIPATVQGQSILPLLNQNTKPKWRSEFFYEHQFGPDIIPPSEGVRTKDWSYIRWVAENPIKEELYNLKSDPQQKSNLISKSQHQKTLSELRNKWIRYKKELE